MKYLKSAICILIVCLMLTGCNFRMASSIDDLISPVSPFGDNADIQKAMDSYAKNGYSLKVPVAGKYNTSPKDKLVLDLMYIEKYSLSDKRILTDSDAHYLWDINEAKNYIELEDEPYSSDLVRRKLIEALSEK